MRRPPRAPATSAAAGPAFPHGAVETFDRYERHADAVRVEQDVLTRAAPRGHRRRWRRRGGGAAGRTGRGGPATSAAAGRPLAMAKSANRSTAPSGVMNVAPHFCGKPASRTRSAAPIAARASLTEASSDSPMWNRGNRSRSSRTTRRPRCASHAAAVEPAGPPPMTTTSQSGLVTATSLPARRRRAWPAGPPPRCRRRSRPRRTMSRSREARGSRARTSRTS